MSKNAFHKDQIVMWWNNKAGWGRGDFSFGKVIKVTPAGGITVQPDDGSEPVSFRARKYGGPGIQVPTAHQIAVRDWELKKPKTRLVTYKAHWTGGEPLLRFEDNMGESKIGPVIRELVILQRWLSEKPQDHSESEDA